MAGLPTFAGKNTWNLVFSLLKGVKGIPDEVQVLLDFWQDKGLLPPEVAVEIYEPTREYVHRLGRKNEPPGLPLNAYNLRQYWRRQATKTPFATEVTLTFRIKGLTFNPDDAGWPP